MEHGMELSRAKWTLLVCAAHLGTVRPLADQASQNSSQLYSFELLPAIRQPSSPTYRLKEEMQSRR